MELIKVNKLSFINEQIFQTIYNFSAFSHVILKKCQHNGFKY